MMSQRRNLLEKRILCLCVCHDNQGSAPATLSARCPADFPNDYGHEDFGLSAWVTWLERCKGAKEEVKRPN